MAPLRDAFYQFWIPLCDLASGKKGDRDPCLIEKLE
jgi:hypothetical protein